MVDTWLTPKEKSTAESTGLMLPESSESEIKASEQLGDIEYELHFKELLDKSPLFKLGLDPQHIYYQREPAYSGAISGGTVATYFQEPIEKFEQLSKEAEGQVRKAEYKEIVKALQNKEIPESDFIFMRGFMLPGDKTVEIKSGLDKSTELSFHMHEFMHRALHTVPQLKKWIEKNKIKKGEEEILMGAFVSKYFPELIEYENKRIRNSYRVDLNQNKKITNTWINEIETIANNILENKGVKVIKPKIKPKPKPKSIMDKEKIIPKIKPKPEQEKKQRTWMEIIKGLFK